MMGAFGAHVLELAPASSALDTFDTAVTYHLVHALAIAIAALALDRTKGKAFRVAGLSFMVGIALFSVSLYALALGGPRWLGPITPLGGIAFIVGWTALGFGAWAHAADAGGP